VHEEGRLTVVRMKIAGLLGFIAICLVTFVALYQMAGGRLPLQHGYEVKALVPQPLNLVPNADVRRDGIKIGRVRDVAPHGADSELTLEIDDPHQTPIHRDATIKVRTKTLVGESYIDLDPGTPRAGAMPNGGGLPLAAADEVVPIERIFSTLDRRTRGDVRRMLRGLGGGLAGRGDQLNRLFGAMRPTVADGGRLMDVLEPQRQQLAALVQNTGQVMSAFGERGQDLRRLIVAAKQAAQAAASRDRRLSESLDELPPTLSQARASVGKLASFAGRATPVIRQLRLATGDLAPAIRDLGPAARQGRRLFRELRPFLAAADPLLSELRPAADKLRAVGPSLDALLREANPALSYLKPYAPEVGSFFSNIPAILKTTDALGHVVRTFPMFSDRAFTGYPKQLRDLVDTLGRTGAAGQFHNPRQNPYPKPGTVGDPQPYDGQYPRIGAGG
jgi:phospholipid/cholesterol/gamma-HCH transport system substrate-binding protein